MAGKRSTSAAPLLLADRYEVRDLLGTGGMARVHRGYDRVLKRDVAIKLLDARSAADQRLLRLFVREARAAAGLVHPNVVTVFDTGVDGDEHFIVMELVEGETLKDLLAREGPLDPERARRIAIDIARGLTAAHGRELVHRDVKPGNVLLDREGTPKVADFGIAHAVEDEQTREIVLGTAAYVSPEQARGRPTSPASDVYALGCVLYEMLAGRPPFEGDHPLAVATRHLHEAPEPVQTLRPETPPHVAAVVDRALRKRPEERHRDASEMLAALEGAATTMGLPARRSRRPRQSPRRLAIWAAAVAAVAGAVLLAPVLLGGSAQKPDRAVAGGGRVEVPEVVGLTEDEAGERLRRAGLVPAFRGGALNDGIQGIVASQDPEPGTRVRTDSIVTLELVLPEADPGPEKDAKKSKEKPEAEDESEGTSDDGDGSSGGGSSGGGKPSPSPSPSPTPTSTPASSADA